MGPSGDNVMPFAKRNSALLVLTPPDGQSTPAGYGAILAFGADHLMRSMRFTQLTPEMAAPVKAYRVHVRTFQKPDLMIGTSPIVEGGWTVK